MSLTLDQVTDVLSRCSFPGYSFTVHGNFNDGSSAYLQARFVAPCATGGEAKPQTTRKWRLSQHMTASEIVQTALKCVLTAVEHEAREHFTYRGQAIFGPHFDVEALVAIRRSSRLEVRE
jgi:hypothetical protein